MGGNNKMMTIYEYIKKGNGDHTIISKNKHSYGYKTFYDVVKKINELEVNNINKDKIVYGWE